MRFPMRLDPWWVPLLAIFGAIPPLSYVAVDADSLRVCFGIFRYRITRVQVVGARRVSGNWLYGIGVHTNFVNGLIVNGSLAGLVELRLNPAQAFWVLFLPTRCTRFYLSLEQPDAFLAALSVGTPASGTPA